MSRVSAPRSLLIALAAFAVAAGVFATLVDATTISPRATAISTLTLVDAKTTSSVVAANAAPGSVVKMKIVVNTASGDRWRSTQWKLGTVVKCDSHNRDGDDGTFVSDGSLTLPANGPVTATAKTFTTDDCTGTATSTETAQVTIGTVAANGPLDEQCGRRIAMVLDESGSIAQTHGATDAVREGAKAFVNSLRDGSTMAVIEFNTQARTQNLGGNLYNTIDDTYANGVFATYINGNGNTSATRYNPAEYSGNTQYTNWQDGMLAAEGLNPAPDFVIFVTDGDPTARNTSTGQETGFPDGSYLVHNPAFAAANALKGAAGQPRILAMGVGAAVTDGDSLSRIKAISGPTEFTGSNTLAESDYVLVSNFDELHDALAQIAAQLCSVRAHLVKQVDELDGRGYQPANGWNVSGTASVSGANPNSYRWLEPGVAQGPPVTSPTRSAATTTIRDAEGRMDFSWLPSPTTLTSQIVLSETLKPGYEFVSVNCEEGVPTAPLRTGDDISVTVTGLLVNQDATCTFKNRRIAGSITVVKVFEGTPVTVKLLVDDEVEKTGSSQTFSTGVLPVRPGHHQVSEAFAQPNYAALYDSSYVCVNGATQVAQGTGTSVEGGVDVPANENVTCTFTNSKDLTGSVSKTAQPEIVDENGAQVRFPVVVVNTSKGPVTITALQDDVFGNLDVDSPASSHSWISSSCQVGGTLDAYDGRPGGADTYSCSFTGRVVGTPDTPHKDVVTVTLEDSTGDTIDKSDEARVDFKDVLPDIDVTKTVDPQYVQDSGPVDYTVVITNTSAVDPLTVDQLSDSVYGDLINGPNKATCEYAGKPVSLPFTLPVGQSMTCTFRVTVTESVSDTVTGSGTDAEGNRVTDADHAIVTVGHTPPPLPIPPEPPVDPTGDPEVVLAVAKTAPETAYVGLGVSAFIYDVRVTNNGKDPAPNTTLNDTAPPSTKFLAIVGKPSQGSCVIQNSGKKLHCDLGTLDPANVVGVRVLIGVRGAPGDHITNTATATCSAHGAVPCQADDSATTRLIAPLLPPCPSISVTPTQLFFGSSTSVGVVVRRAGGAPVGGGRIVLLGPGINVIVKTDSSGHASATVRPSQAGVLRARLASSPLCPPREVAVLPGVTG